MAVYECSHGVCAAGLWRDATMTLGPDQQQVRGDVEQIPAPSCACHCASHATRTMAQDVPPTYFDLLDLLIGRSLLAGYARAFADPISHLKLGQLLQTAEPIQIEWELLSPKELLRACLS